MPESINTKEVRNLSHNRHRIEFDPGDVVKPEYDPKNNLVGIIVTDSGYESLRSEFLPFARGESEEENASPSERIERVEQLERRVTKLEMMLLDAGRSMGPRDGSRWDEGDGSDADGTHDSDGDSRQ